MKHAVCRELYSYWDSLRRGRAAPERGDVDPAAIRGTLSDTFIVGAERDLSGSEFPVRLSGTRLNALFLSELKGRNLLDLWSATDRPEVARLVQSVLDDACPLVAAVRGGPPHHRPIDLEMVLLPLRHHGRTHARILGAIAPVEVPSWLGLLALDTLSLTSLRFLDQTKHRAEPAEPAIPSDVAPRRYGRFTVHQGGR